MIPTSEQLAAALAGAVRLFCFDNAGLARFERTIEAFWQSFFCALVIAPLFVALTALRLDEATLAEPFLRIAAVKTIAYVIGWTAFPLAMAYLVRVLEREDRYFGYIVAYNWISAPQTVMALAVALISVSEVLPESVSSVLEIGALVYQLAVLWNLAHQALEISGGTAALVVAIDFLLSELINATAQWLLSAGTGAG